MSGVCFRQAFQNSPAIHTMRAWIFLPLYPLFFTKKTQKHPVGHSGLSFMRRIHHKNPVIALKKNHVFSVMQLKSPTNIFLYYTSNLEYKSISKNYSNQSTNTVRSFTFPCEKCRFIIWNTTPTCDLGVAPLLGIHSLKTSLKLT